ncbi:acylphosphatase [Chloroflexota bacterium]
MADLASVKVTVHGGVQRVFFRASTKEQAITLGLVGCVRNLPDGKAVEVEAEGEKNKLEELITYLRTGPPRATVDRVDISWSEYTARYKEFSILY